MSRGFVMFAHNNAEVNYGEMALANGVLIKKNMKHNKICLVTDEYTLEYLHKTRGEEFVNSIFDNIKMVDITMFKNVKIYRDTKHRSVELKWNNNSRVNVYDLTPFDETIVIDTDYLILDDTLEHVWGCNSDILINDDAITLLGKSVNDSERHLTTGGLKMAWATLVYFKKNKDVSCFFDLVKHISDNYRYYSVLYDFSDAMYRNDYVFTIARHMMGGGVEKNGYGSFLNSKLLTSYDCDDIISYGNNAIVFLAQTDLEYDFQVVKVKDTNVHVMNKFALGRIADSILKEAKYVK